MLTQKQQRQLAELAFIRSIADKELDEKKIKNGRLKGLLLKLQKNVDKELTKLSIWPGPIDIKAIEAKLDYLKYSIGPCDEEFSITAMISFCLGFIEESENKIDPVIIDTLNKIIDYFERDVSQGRDFCYRDGQISAEKWEMLF